MRTYRNGNFYSAVTCILLCLLYTKKGRLFTACSPSLHTHTHTQGDTNIRYFEVTDQKPYAFFLSQMLGNIPQRGACVMPQHNLDYLRCEVMRFYRLQHTKGVVEPMPMIVPRKVCVVCVV